MKICVLVKEVPDAAVEKRINPSTGRMDRSGEKNLNPFDTHAIEAAMQLKEGGAIEVDEVVAVTMGPESAVRALHKAVSLGADRSDAPHRRGAGRLGRQRHRATRWPRSWPTRLPTWSCWASSPTTASATRSAPSWPTTCGCPR